MKRIVICCDGTWRRLESAHPTNVVRTACAVLPVDLRGPDPVHQLVFHFDGVGTGSGDGWVPDLYDRTLGGVFGIGLERRVADAYRTLVFNYQPGDEIYLFGFSRGAFTARSVAGLIRQSGILSRTRSGKIGEALDLYRDKEPRTAWDADESRAFRADNAPEVALEGDIAWRNRNRPGRNHDATQLLTIRYVGVWDTVGALGVPGVFTRQPLIHHSRQFHDTSLAPIVEAARHAVAIDERRRAYEPTLWDNLPELNRLRPGAYQQRWFPGVHGAVGGGGPDTRLSHLALDWVLEGAASQGLALDGADRDAWAAKGDPLGPLSPHAPERGVIAAISAFVSNDREGPVTDDAHAISRAAHDRWRGDPDWRPRTLDRVRSIMGRAGSP